MTVFNPECKVDLNSVILWQYDKAINLQNLIKKSQNFYNGNVNDFLDWFYDNVFNLNTCGEIGLEIWGNMVGAPRPRIKRTKKIERQADGTYKEVQVTPYYEYVSLKTWRTYIRAKIHVRRCNGSAGSINNYLAEVFGTDSDGNARVITLRDYHDMSISYNVTFDPTSDDEALIELGDEIFLRPAGVLSNIKNITVEDMEKENSILYLGLTDGDDAQKRTDTQTGDINNLDHSILYTETK